MFSDPVSIILTAFWSFRETDVYYFMDEVRYGYDLTEMVSQLRGAPTELMQFVTHGILYTRTQKQTNLKCTITPNEYA